VPDHDESHVPLDPARWRDELRRRMAGPQRHRLLQGYPMLPLMRPAETVSTTGRPSLVLRRLDGTLEARGPELPREPAWVEIDPARPVIVGVLPHTQCNPRVEGCGFCTFPHDRYSKPTLYSTVEAVCGEVAGFFAAHPEMARRRVDGLYFGGATANLTPPMALRELGEKLAKHLDLRGAEVTLEGVPSLFRSLFTGPFEVLLDLPARHRRISMGVQTFDPAQLRRMGRQGFGDRGTVEKVVAKAHRHGLTASGDFLVNLPHQPRETMLDDAREAAAMGLDQICVYHLVLTERTGTPWASDPSLLAALPSVAEACDHWLAVRAWLLDHGYVQTTLTNFERADVHATDRRFVYEPHSFTPDRYDALGFGPLSISTFVDVAARRAVKHVRGKSIGVGQSGNLYFAYDEEDLRLLHLTRTLVRLRVDRAAYRALFGADVEAHFGGALAAVVEAGLAELDEEALRLTPRGMFYADSVAGLLAWPRVEALRASGAGRHTRDLLDHRLLVDSDFMG
jgi:coproporphyrinogen III oxidase-like Fe-S oxidoreductase